MVATFHLQYLRHRRKYENLEVGNASQQLLSPTRPCYSIDFIESFLFCFILVSYNIGIYIRIYIYIYIYKVSFIHCFLLSSIVMLFSALHAKHFEIWKDILWNWWVDCFIAWSIKWCDISGCSYWIHFPFYGVFFSQENCVSFGLLVSCLSLSQSA